MKHHHLCRCWNCMWKITNLTTVGWRLFCKTPWANVNPLEEWSSVHDKSVSNAGDKCSVKMKTTDWWLERVLLADNRRLPQTIWLVNVLSIWNFCSWPEEWLMCFEMPSCVRLGFWRKRNIMFFVFDVCPIDVDVQRHEDGSISEQFVQVGSCSLSSFLGSPEATAVLCVMVKVSTRTRRVFRVFLPIHNIQEILWTTHLLLPSFFWLRMMFIHFTETKYRIRINVNIFSTDWRLCCVAKPFSSMELYSIRSRIYQIYHPSDSRSVSAKYRTLVWPFLKSVFLGCSQIHLEILSKMSCSLRNRWLWKIPDHRIDVNVWHIVSSKTTQFLSYIWISALQHGQTLFLDISKLLWDNFAPMVFFVVSGTSLPVLEIVIATECHTWELDDLFSFKPFATGLLVPVRSEFEKFALSVPRFETRSEVGDWSAVFRH